jgi:hypothetical protein
MFVTIDISNLLMNTVTKVRVFPGESNIQYQRRRRACVFLLIT